MRGTQFFAAASSPDQPCHHLHNPTPTRRQIHVTPAAHFGALRAQIPPVPPQRSERSWIHESFVTRHLATAPQNSILGEPPPSHNPDETTLGRVDRVHLSRLRCGHHPGLLSYEARLRPETDPTCRWCGLREESLTHLFEDCPGTAAERLRCRMSTPRDLWDFPVRSVAFLRATGIVTGPL